MLRAAHTSGTSCLFQFAFPSVFNIRIKDEDGTWGDVYSKVILVHNGVSARSIKIQEGEFFWDTDPGQGSGTSILTILQVSFLF